MLDDTMELVCKKEGGAATVCAITRSTGLSLAESFEIACVTAEADVSLFLGPATTFFSYSWTGTKLADMLYAIIRRVEALEKEDGRRRYVWIDMFCASQTLLAGVFLPSDPKERDALKASNPIEYGRRKEQTDKLFDGAIDSVNEIFFYCSPLADEWLAPPHPFLLPDRGEPPGDWMRRGPWRGDACVVRL